MRYALDYEVAVFSLLLDIDELIENIVEYLDAITICISVQLASKRLYRVTNNQKIWKQLCISNEFDKRLNELRFYNPDGENDYKRIYTTLYVRDRIEAENEEDHLKNAWSMLPTYSIEYAKSARSNCQTCGRTIGRGVLRVVKTVSDEPDAHKYHHWSCYMDKFPKRIRRELDLHGYHTLQEKDRIQIRKFLQDKQQKRKMEFQKQFSKSVCAYSCDVCSRLCTNSVYRNRCHGFDMCHNCFTTFQEVDDERCGSFVSEEVTVHTCSLCSGTISGALFYCRVCSHYELCEKCCAQVQNGHTQDSHDPMHSFYFVGYSELFHLSSHSNKRLHDEIVEDSQDGYETLLKKMRLRTGKTNTTS
jgi:hypothetical protein